MAEDTRLPLVRPVPKGGDWRGNALIGGSWENEMMLAPGFLDAGNILVEYWKAHRPDDTLALPILYNLRHGIELALKIAIRDAAACARRDGIVDAKWERDELDQRLGRTHKIGSLAEELNECLALLKGIAGTDNGQLDVDTKEVLDSLHNLDESGQAFRYSVVKTGSGKHRKLAPARPDVQYVDLEHIAGVLYEVGVLVFGGVCSVLEQYRDRQQANRDAQFGPAGA
ncbi:hypothetical protein [Streptomyces sp. cg2]|uniref:hypothetical protein n=1 Tax=Streptomyces sp. cg2 TaxID=3238799 RepID=UPI0034E19496